jgi:hypothetical protein
MDSPFRQWMDLLKQPRGAEAEWPHLLRQMLADTYLQIRESEGGYAGEVFKDRDDDYPFVASAGTEKRLVKELFHHCRLTSGRRFEIGTEPYWLMGYEWPNQGGNKDKMARADLVGLNSMGGVVVFECKRGTNGDDGPLMAVMEGLDYLSHLTTRSNFAKIEAGFGEWIGRQNAVWPNGFVEVKPSREATHEVVVMAPPEYFARHRDKSPGWELFASLPISLSSPVIRFAESDFASPHARWVTG